jgi:hypothetical protein
VLLGIYGIVLVVLGIVDLGSGDSGGINLFTGIGMIVVAALLILWAVTRPIVVDEVELAKDKAASEADVAAIRAVEAADRTGQGDAGSH